MEAGGEMVVTANVELNGGVPEVYFEVLTGSFTSTQSPFCLASGVETDYGLLGEVSFGKNPAHTYVGGGIVPGPEILLGVDGSGNLLPGVGVTQSLAPTHEVTPPYPRVWTFTPEPTLTVTTHNPMTALSAVGTIGTEAAYKETKPLAQIVADFIADRMFGRR